ncbi:MAG: hypothetical protein ACK4FN_02785 [Acinetobacter johnsonii]
MPKDLAITKASNPHRQLIDLEAYWTPLCCRKYTTEHLSSQHMTAILRNKIGYFVSHGFPNRIQGNDLAAHAYMDRENIGGNFCGHYPASPRLTLESSAKKGKGGVPRVLTLCIERLKDYYYRPRKVIPSLDLANGSSRQQRSERREACICLLSSLLKFTDVASLRVGIPTKNGFVNLTVDLIAKHAGMHQKRIERALHDLKAAGLVTVGQQREKKADGSWIGLAAVKAISKHLFGVFGLATMLKFERDKASKRLKKKEKGWEQESQSYAKAQTQTGKARFSLFNEALGNKEPAELALRPRANDPPPENAKLRLQKMLRAADFKQANPSWSREQCYEEASK